jgi:putative heme-binding domain-containing protein
MAPGTPEAGRLAFTKYCAACHKIANEGALVGPQLDGIGQRGLERLCEDILDPNRNVDIAFRSTLFTLKDGDIVSGLFRREEGETIIVAESTGKEITVPKGNIAERRESEMSLMPENFGDLIPPAEFADLMAYLLSRNASAK